MSEDFNVLNMDPELNFYFPEGVMPGVEANYFLPGPDSIPDDELRCDEEVPKKYGIPDSIVASAIVDEDIRDFRLENYRDIRDAGSLVDKVLYDEDNGQDMIQPGIRNRLTDAYEMIIDTKERVEAFETDAATLIYSEQNKEAFQQYLDDMLEVVRQTGWRNDINVEREFERSDGFDVHSALEPRREAESGSVSMSDTGTATKFRAD